MVISCQSSIAVVEVLVHCEGGGAHFNVDQSPSSRSAFEFFASSPSPTMLSLQNRHLCKRNTAPTNV
eukprot:2311425-Amphidinium_carterae.1